MLTVLTVWVLLSMATLVVVCRFIHISKIRQGE